MKKADGFRSVVMTASAAVAVAILVAACGQEAAPAAKPAAATSLPAKIAAVDAGAVKDEQSPEVVRARTALAAAAASCKVTELQVAEMLGKSRKVLSGEGKSMQMVELLESLPALADNAKVEADSCQKLMAAYTTARQAGQSQQVAISGLKIQP